MERPTNLTERAMLDLLDIVGRSFDEYGEEQSRATELRILDRCRLIEIGRTRGHKRSFKTLVPVLYHYERPWLIVFDPDTRAVYTIIHGARDVGNLLR